MSHIQSFSLRLKVYMRDFFICVYCKKAMNPLDDRLSLDHVDPDGPDTEDNLVTSCKGCNSIKSKININELARQIALKKGPSLVVETRMAKLLEETTNNAMSLEQLLQAVSKGHEINISLLIGKHRTNERRAVRARADFAVQARRMGYSLPSIGKVLEMHHTSIIHLINRYSPELTREITVFEQGELQDNK